MTNWKKTVAIAATAVFPLGCAEAAAWHDGFYWLGEINKATIIINTEQGLLDSGEAAQFAKGLQQVLVNGGKPGAKRPQSVITFEPLLIEAAGEDVTKIHAGRSSQDMLSAVQSIQTEEALLDLADKLVALDRTLLMIVDRERETVIPCYTNGVAAQPNRYSHYLLAYHDAFARDIDRLREYYARLNKSPLGTTVLNGTSWPLDRDKMAEYMGFDGLRYNAYDAVQVFSLENGTEAGYVATSIALHVGSFIEDVMQQYAQPRPWIILKEGGNNTYVSSAMPQKRNPGLLNRTRALASTVIGEAAGATLRAHNIPPGIPDSRGGIQAMLADTAKLVKDFDAILQALVIDPARSLEELNLDWTASQEVADILMRQYDIPFRIGHHFASEMVGFARANGYTPLTFPYEEAQRIYRETVTGHSNAPAELPLDRAAFKAALDPVAIVDNRATKGASQAEEVDLMYKTALRENERNTGWLKSAQKRISDATARRDRDFSAILNGE